MKKTGKLFLPVLLLALFLSSCWQDESVPEIPTLAEEQLKLKSYIDGLIEKGSDVDTTESGNYYVIMEEGEGEFANPGDTLIVGYAGYLVDGKLFDASEWHNQDGTFEFVLGIPPMIKGWDDGMLVMNKNAKIQLIVPSANAYGIYGSGTIPPYTTLVFVIKMVDIKPSA